MTSDKVLEKAIWECYVRLYNAATPSTDFNWLAKNAPRNPKTGKKEIYYMDYELEQKEFDEIVKKVMKDFDVKPEGIRQRFKTTIYLGCSPSFKPQKK